MTGPVTPNGWRDDSTQLDAKPHLPGVGKTRSYPFNLKLHQTTPTGRCLHIFRFHHIRFHHI